VARTAHSPSSSGGTSHSSRPLRRTLDKSIEELRQIADAGTTSWPRSPGSLRARGMSPGHSPRVWADWRRDAHPRGWATAVRRWTMRN
jgi:hypothetical protein